jgi:hypothetical protein
MSTMMRKNQTTHIWPAPAGTWWIEHDDEGESQEFQVVGLHLTEWDVDRVQPDGRYFGRYFAAVDMWGETYEVKEKPEECDSSGRLEIRPVA